MGCLKKPEEQYCLVPNVQKIKSIRKLIDDPTYPWGDNVVIFLIDKNFRKLSRLLVAKERLGAGGKKIPSSLESKIIEYTLWLENRGYSVIKETGLTAMKKEV